MSEESLSGFLLVLVSMMQVRHMSMIMLQRQMPMPMSVGPHHFLFVLMVMMEIGVGMDMVVFHTCMNVKMFVMWPENPNPYGHRRPCQILRNPAIVRIGAAARAPINGAVPKNAASQGGAQNAQGIDVQHETDFISHKSYNQNHTDCRHIGKFIAHQP